MSNDKNIVVNDCPRKWHFDYVKLARIAEGHETATDMKQIKGVFHVGSSSVGQAAKVSYPDSEIDKIRESKTREILESTYAQFTCRNEACPRRAPRSSPEVCYTCGKKMASVHTVAWAPGAMSYLGSI